MPSPGISFNLGLFLKHISEPCKDGTVPEHWSGPKILEFRQAGWSFDWILAHTTLEDVRDYDGGLTKLRLDHRGRERSARKWQNQDGKELTTPRRSAVQHMKLIRRDQTILKVLELEGGIKTVEDCFHPTEKEQGEVGWFD